MSEQNMSRKNFLKGVLGTMGLFTIVPRRVLGGTGYTAPSDELTKAVIGVGMMGKGHLTYPGARLVAICDIDQSHLQESLNLVSDDVNGYTDYRELLAQDDIDIVHIATPPHWHAKMAVDAAEAGKDIWCEKPMTRTIGEGKKVVDAVQRNGRIFRLNTWFRFRDIFYGMGTPVKPIKKLVANDVFGWPLKVTINESTGFNWKFNWTGLTNLQPEWIPEPLNYDMWLGPAPYKPYNQHRTHVTFRGYWDYDGGGLGDMGQHYLDPVQYILDKDHTSPTKITADSEQQHPDAVGSWRRIEMTYDDGCQIILDGENKDTDAAFIEGPKGKLFRGFQSDIPNIRKLAASLPDSVPQVTDFSKAVKNRQAFALNESNGHRSCNLVNLGKIAVRLGRDLEFDPEKQRFIGDEAANRLINQPMRSPWKL
ncbi:Gfo/Idh/MocA family oxidoreductase [Aliifodinibius sp. S!AR15-10]|uniref:Gfo/Idh/MocA family oxidoreductase n=1 Tax=Aliifodinibius sp. S!AR15-10 TaxID=2950437 RepID=UPI002859BC99|nr:Gfo/Idh/MocA family oxidoreductase [Aliifodinibius sp. S!AR15-10]MDR8392128.1 Gfo/Idh/MocA family oxidoreductase [Aliifodinibius sp. S!AR15-10]